MPKPVTQCQNRIRFVEPYDINRNKAGLIAILEMVAPKVRHGWQLAVTEVPLDGSAELIHTEVSQADCPEAGPDGVWCLVTPYAVLHADDVIGSYIKFVESGDLKLTKRVYNDDSDTPNVL